MCVCVCILVSVCLRVRLPLLLETCLPSLYSLPPCSQSSSRNFFFLVIPSPGPQLRFPLLTFHIASPLPLFGFLSTQRFGIRTRLDGGKSRAFLPHHYAFANSSTCARHLRQSTNRLRCALSHPRHVSLIYPMLVRVRTPTHYTPLQTHASESESQPSRYLLRVALCST